MSQQLIEKDKIQTVVNKLFIYTDNRNWSGILEEVFAPEVLFDMVSLLGGEPSIMPAQTITKGWDEGLKPLEAVHHQTGNFDIVIESDTAIVNCYGIAYHYRQHPTGQNTRVFVGSYVSKLQKILEQWRINAFAFNKKFIDGNLQLA